MSEKTEKIFSIALSLLILLGICTSIIGLIRDYRNTKTYGGVDLRVKITSSRILMSGIEPYFYVWKNGDSPMFLEPSDNANLPTTGNTTPPSFLTLIAPVANLPYKTLKFAWFAMQWILLLASLWLLISTARSTLQIKAILVLGLLFIASDEVWRLHVERGQDKIIYVFLLSLAYWISQKNFSQHLFWSGFAAGFTASLRPPVMAMFIPTVLLKNWRLLSGMLSGFLCGILSPLFLTGIAIWENYFHSMRIYSNYLLGFLNVPFKSHPSFEIEGMNNLGTYFHFPYTVDSSVFGLVQNTFNYRLTPGMLLIGLIVAMSVSSFWIHKHRQQFSSIPRLFLIGYFLVFLGEYFLPTPRFPYCNVIWLLPLALIILKFRTLKSLSIPLIVMGLNLLLLAFSKWSWVCPTAGNYLVLFYVGFTAFSLRENSSEGINNLTT